MEKAVDKLRFKFGCKFKVYELKEIEIEREEKTTDKIRFCYLLDEGKMYVLEGLESVLKIVRATANGLVDPQCGVGQLSFTIGTAEKLRPDDPAEPPVAGTSIRG